MACGSKAGSLILLPQHLRVGRDAPSAPCWATSCRTYSPQHAKIARVGDPESRRCCMEGDRLPQLPVTVSTANKNNLQCCLTMRHAISQTCGVGFGICLRLATIRVHQRKSAARLVFVFLSVSVPPCRLSLLRADHGPTPQHTIEGPFLRRMLRIQLRSYGKLSNSKID